jgi:hypothetical protein
VFIAYGIACFFSPGLPAGYAGLVMSNGDAFSEIGAMYGGLQTGFGLFCLIAALKPEHYRSGLLLLVICIGLRGSAVFHGDRDWGGWHLYLGGHGV